MYTVFNEIYLVICSELLAVFNKKFYTKNEMLIATILNY